MFEEKVKDETDQSFLEKLTKSRIKNNQYQMRNFKKIKKECTCSIFYFLCASFQFKKENNDHSTNKNKIFKTNNFTLSRFNSKESIVPNPY